MKNIQIILLTLITGFAFTTHFQAYGIDYSTCDSIQEAIKQETQEITNAHSTNHPILAELYASRGESYLMNAQYDQAIEDFINANSHIGHGGEEDMSVAFRVAFGEVVSYDNLGMRDQAEQALHQLQIIASHVGCDDCLEHKPCLDPGVLTTTPLHYRSLIKLASNHTHFQSLVLTCKNKKNKDNASAQESSEPSQANSDNYSDVIGPDIPPYSSWCEEAVTATGSLMIGIACLAPSNGVKIALTSVINALTVRGVKCCQAGGFWKACVAPVCRKWKEWKLFKNQNLIPNSQNLHLYIN